MIYLGVDPGKEGGFATLYGDEVTLSKMPESDGELLAYARELHDRAKKMKEGVRIAMEKVGGYVGGGGQPGSRMYNFGDNNGAVRVSLKSVGFTPVLVTPQNWQKGLSIPPRKKRRLKVGVIHQEGETKEEWKSRLRRIAQELFPWVIIPTWGADALLIAEYLRRKEERRDEVNVRRLPRGDKRG